MKTLNELPFITSNEVSSSVKHSCLSMKTYNQSLLNLKVETFSYNAFLTKKALDRLPNSIKRLIHRDYSDQD